MEQLELLGRRGESGKGYYERALFNHILSSINTKEPGYVYFTPIRPGHYRVYSEPQHSFWCCVGTGMENPGRYGSFIYARARDGLFVNLFIPAELKAPGGITLRQETKFPFEPRTRLTLSMDKPVRLALYLRHPAWVEPGAFAVKVNGKAVESNSSPSSYARVERTWQNGDVVEVELPMRIAVEHLPDGSDWVAILHGPIVLAAPTGTSDLVGLRADDARMGHVAHGPLIPMDQVSVLLATDRELPRHVVPDSSAGPLHFRLRDVTEPKSSDGLPLVPFFALHDSRYQMYWELTSLEKIAARREHLAADERARAAREAATIDSVAIGEQQPEVEHELKGEGMDSGTFEGRRWRHGAWFQYTLAFRGEKAADLVVTYWGGDSGRTFDISANGTLLATESLKEEKPRMFFERIYPIPADVLASARDGRVAVKFAAQGGGLAGGIFDIRLMKPAQ